MSSGNNQSKIINALESLVEKRRIVFWYDENGEMEETGAKARRILLCALLFAKRKTENEKRKTLPPGAPPIAPFKIIS